jgi:hypothetical protein
MHNLNTFGARTNHGETWLYKTHHNLDLGETTTFPLIVYSMLGHKTSNQMAFCLEIPQWKSRNSQSLDSRDFGAYNFVCRPLIEMRFEGKF